jgi:uncharacterized phiE125 gp8 family phage protein
MDSIVIAATGDSEEPVTVDMAKAHCRVDVDGDDALFESIYIPAARQTVEQYTGLTLLSSDVDVLVCQCDVTQNVIAVPVQPVASVTALATVDADGVQTPLDLVEYGIAVAKIGMRSVIVARNGPLPSAPYYRVQYVAGYAENATPPNLLLAILEYVGDAYENREAQQTSQAINDNPRAVRLMDPFRISFGL